jgi:transcription elongation factor Elf1
MHNRGLKVTIEGLKKKLGDDITNNAEWLICPFCKSKTRTRIREDTTLTNFPLFCPKCKKETLVSVKQLNTEIVIEPDAKDAEPERRRADVL